MTNLTAPQQMWVDALNSGEYSQTKHTLQDGTGFCCLGVACDLYDKNVAPLKKIGVLLGGGELGYYPEVRAWLGLEGDCGRFSRKEDPFSLETSLTTLNDIEGYTFSQIAEIIKSKPEGLFKG